VGIPIITNGNGTQWKNDLDTTSCYWSNKIDRTRGKNDSSYSKGFYLRDALRSQYQIAFNLSDEQIQNMTFRQAYLFADAVYSERYAGVPQKVDWSEREIGMINTT